MGVMEDMPEWIGRVYKCECGVNIGDTFTVITEPYKKGIKGTMVVLGVSQKFGKITMECGKLTSSLDWNRIA